MSEETVYKVTLDRPFGIKVGGGESGTFVVYCEEDGNADKWNKNLQRCI